MSIGATARGPNQQHTRSTDFLLRAHSEHNGLERAASFFFIPWEGEAAEKKEEGKEQEEEEEEEGCHRWISHYKKAIGAIPFSIFVTTLLVRRKAITSCLATVFT